MQTEVRGFYGLRGSSGRNALHQPSGAFFSEQPTLVDAARGTKAQLVSDATIFAEGAGNEYMSNPASVGRDAVGIPASTLPSAIGGCIGYAPGERAVVREAYFVTERGIRQDFVVTQRVQGEGELQLANEVSGAKHEIRGDAVVFQLPVGASYDYSHLAVFDALGKRLPATFEGATDHSFCRAGGRSRGALSHPH